MAAIHAARPKAIRELLLDDVDLGNRRLVIAGHTRPLDEFTHRVILDWLDYRRSRWPNTTNLHMIVSQQSALETGPVSKVWITNALRGLTATLERLRVDRQMEDSSQHQSVTAAGGDARSGRGRDTFSVKRRLIAEHSPGDSTGRSAEREGRVQLPSPEES